MARKKIGEILIEEGVLDETRLRAALVEQQRWGGPLGRLLVDMKLLDEKTLVEALSRQLHIPKVDLDSVDIPMQVTDLVPGELAEQHSVMPFAAQLKFLDLAMADPTNLGIVDELQIRTRLNVRPHLAGPKAIERAIARYYGRGMSVATMSRRAIDLEPTNEEVAALQKRVSQLEALVQRDEAVLRKVLALLVEKGVATREEIVERLK